MVNEEILQRQSGAEKQYISVDKVESKGDEDTSNYPAEFLHRLTPSEMLQHKINRMIDAIVMLLPNLDVNQSLCNGTRLIVRRLQNHISDCDEAKSFNKGNRVLIPRITSTLSDAFMPFKLRRRQFSIRLSFAITINKSQGQTLNRFGLPLLQPVFTHGQLYVAFSRVRSSTPIKVKVITKEQTSETKTTETFVFEEIW